MTLLSRGTKFRKILNEEEVRNCKVEDNVETVKF